MVRSLLAWVLSVLAPCQEVFALMMGGSQRQPGVGDGISDGPSRPCLSEDFLQDTGPSRCTPAVEVPTWIDGRGCVGVIDHVLQGLPLSGGACGWTRPRLSHRTIAWWCRTPREPSTRRPDPRYSCAPSISRSVTRASRGPTMRPWWPPAGSRAHDQETWQTCTRTS